MISKTLALTILITGLALISAAPKHDVEFGYYDYYHGPAYLQHTHHFHNHHYGHFDHHFNHHDHSSSSSSESHSSSGEHHSPGYVYNHHEFHP